MAMRMQLFFSLFLFLMAAACQSASHHQDFSNSRESEAKKFQAVTLQNSLVRTFHSNEVGVDYKLYISLPKGYSDSKFSYPIIFVLDADYFFNVVQSIMTDGSDHNEMDQAVVVGITYPGVAEDRHGPVGEQVLVF